MTVEATQEVRIFLIPGGDPADLPGSFPIEPDPGKKSDLPGSFPIDPDPDKISPDDLPISFPIDPDPDDTKSGGS